MSVRRHGSEREPLVLVVAVGRGRVIGHDGGLPWHFSEDLRHFKRVTLGHAVIMGRRTWEEVGKPLPGRTNIVISRRADLALPAGVARASSLEEAIARARAGDPEPRVIGGGMIYRLALPLATRVLLTEVDLDAAGDTTFPELDPAEWVEVARERGQKSPELSFVTLERRQEDA